MLLGLRRYSCYTSTHQEVGIALLSGHLEPPGFHAEGSQTCLGFDILQKLSDADVYVPPEIDEPLYDKHVGFTYHQS